MNCKLTAILLLLAGATGACDSTPNVQEGEGGAPAGAVDLDCPIGELGPSGTLTGEITVLGRVVTYSYTVEDEALATVVDAQGREDRCQLAADVVVGGAICEDQYRCAACDVLLQQSEEGDWYLKLIGFQAGCERYGGSLQLQADE